MNKIIKFSFLTIASCLLLGAQVGVQSVIMAGVSGPPPLNPCLVAAYPMNEGSGLTLHDTVGGNNATINAGGSVTWQSNSGFPGTTPHWNGTGFADTATAAPLNFNGSTPFSISLWASRLVSEPNSGAWMSNVNQPANTLGWELIFGFAVATDIRPILINSYPSNALDILGLGFGAGLQYIVITYDGSRTPAGIVIYNNATTGTQTTQANTLSATTASTNPVRFGALLNGSTEYTGVMAFAEVYNCVLTPTQVSTYYASGPGIY